MRALSTKYAEAHGWGDEHLQQLRSNPTVMAQLIQEELRATYTDPVFEGVDPAFLEKAIAEAKDDLTTSTRTASSLSTSPTFPQCR